MLLSHPYATPSKKKRRSGKKRKKKGCSFHALHHINDEARTGVRRHRSGRSNSLSLEQRARHPARADETVKNDELKVENGKLANDDDDVERTEETIRSEMKEGMRSHPGPHIDRTHIP